MDNIRRQDLRLFVRELADIRYMSGAVAVILVIAAIGSKLHHPYGAAFGIILILVSWSMTAWSASERKRFYDQRMLAMWAGCQDRVRRLEEVLKKCRKEQVADLREMPNTIRGISRGLYTALRRADIIAYEVGKSESGIIGSPPAWSQNSSDPQSRELFRLADKNIAEYRAQYAGVMAGVQRTEAQSAVFMTTLDTLRMKIIGYRLVGKSPSLSSQDFLEALAEARLQLESIDTALEELDMGLYPQMIAVVSPNLDPATPPAMPTDVAAEIQQRLG